MFGEEKCEILDQHWIFCLMKKSRNSVKMINNKNLNKHHFVTFEFVIISKHFNELP